MRHLLHIRSGSHHLKIVFFALLFTASGLSAQVVGTDLRAIGYNGKIVIRTINSSVLSSYFSLVNGNVDIDFYFGQDDPRNGIHVGVQSPQPNGQIYIRFGDLNYQQGDTLSFFATELLGSTIRHYVFVRGDYFPESGGPITICPSHFTCEGKGILFHFDDDEFVLSPSSISPITLVIPGAGIDIVRNTWGFSVDKNAIVLKFLPVLNCNQVMSGSATFSINGITCYFENGLLTCPPWTEIPDDLSNTCAPYFEDCLPELIDLLSELKYTLPCQQWVDYTTCSTTSFINRPGEVAIGTSRFAENAKLTVKNGIITDKVKVTNTGWGDYVFDEGYPLMPIAEVEAYISRYNHLPNMPNGKDVEMEGSFELGETTINHQVKIEEIFLHLIELEQETQRLESLLFWCETMHKIQIRK